MFLGTVRAISLFRSVHCLTSGGLTSGIEVRNHYRSRSESRQRLEWKGTPRMYATRKGLRVHGGRSEPSHANAAWSCIWYRRICDAGPADWSAWYASVLIGSFNDRASHRGDGNRSCRHQECKGNIAQRRHIDHSAASNTTLSTTSNRLSM